ncbi:MAG: creatininase family protein [Fidelibacterota bacterium]|nr:MAG: creatininase family protein [Candidatus Neomarinimicrobiota bacterium]
MFQHRVAFCATITLLLPLILAGQKAPTTREMNLINWQEFQEFVPGKIETVLLATGTVEPHGAIPNGSDNLAPEAMARALAGDLNALIAPTLNFGVTGAMKAFPGALAISPEAYGPFIRDILRSLARNGFINIIILNGHGGPQSPLLQQAADDISLEQQVRILVVNWWSLVSEETFAVFGENGGHAGNNETAYIQAVVPDHIHPDRYRKDMATPNPVDNAWHAVPFPSSIGLYEEGQGYPTFDPRQSRDYFNRVNRRVLALVKDIITKWDQAGLYRGD